MFGWGSHPSTLNIIYKSVIRSKLDYCYYFSDSSAILSRKNLNKLQISRFRSILGTLKSIPLTTIKVETAYLTSRHPMKMACRRILVLTCSEKQLQSALFKLNRGKVNGLDRLFKLEGKLCPRVSGDMVMKIGIVATMWV